MRAFDKAGFMDALKKRIPSATDKPKSEEYRSLLLESKTKKAHLRSVTLGHGLLSGMYRKGAFHAEKLLDKALHDDDYLNGYADHEHPIVVKRVEGEAPRYSISGVHYSESIGEWHCSVQEALLNARISRDPLQVFLKKRVSFDQFVNDDRLIKTDVDRAYSQDFDGNIQCSIDGKEWWFGGVMDFPLIPMVRVFSDRADVKNNQWVDGYINIKATHDLLCKKSLTKLKPKKPVEPEYFSESVWWDRHKQHHDDCFWNWLTENQAIKNWFNNGEQEVCNWRCEHFHEKKKLVAEQQEQYETAIKTWLEL